LEAASFPWQFGQLLLLEGAKGMDRVIGFASAFVGPACLAGPQALAGKEKGEMGIAHLYGLDAQWKGI
jgi:hypothetical protein